MPIERAAVATTNTSMLLTPTGGLSPSTPKVETMPRAAARSNLTLTAGTIHVVSVVIPATTITNVSMLGGVGATLPTNWWFEIVQISDRQILAVTGDQTTQAFAAGDWKTIAFTTPLTLGVATPCWIAFMMAGTTVVSPVGSTLASTNIGGLAPVYAGTSSTGQTSPGAVGAILQAPIGSTSAPYMVLT